METAKIVATPTLLAWSQVYNAGKLFAVLSLQKPPQKTLQNNEGVENPQEETKTLSQTGKEILDKLEQEFFSIVVKDLASIKQAIEKTFKDLPSGITYSFAACAFTDLSFDRQVLYAFSQNLGTVFLKRGEKLGKILDGGASSGFLENHDLVILVTKPFADLFSVETLSSQIQNQTPAEIAEILSPIIHNKEEGGASAIVIRYVKHEKVGPEMLPATELTKVNLPDFKKYILLLMKKLRLPPMSLNTVGNKRKAFLTLAFIIFLILVLSVFLALKKQEISKRAALFSEIYPQAEKKYEEGQSLLDLNKNLARDSFLAAQKILKENKDKFPAKSKEATQTQDLLKKVDSGLTQVSPVDSSGLDRSKLSITVENGSGIEGTAGKAAGILKELGYNVASIGNADNYNYQGIIIKVKKAKSEFVNLLKKDLSKDYSVSLGSSDLPSDSPSDALIIIGK